MTGKEHDRRDYFYCRNKETIYPCIQRYGEPGMEAKILLENFGLFSIIIIIQGEINENSGRNQ